MLRAYEITFSKHREKISAHKEGCGKSDISVCWRRLEGYENSFSGLSEPFFSGLMTYCPASSWVFWGLQGLSLGTIKPDHHGIKKKWEGKPSCMSHPSERTPTRISDVKRGRKHFKYSRHTSPHPPPTAKTPFSRKEIQPSLEKGPLVLRIHCMTL